MRSFGLGLALNLCHLGACLAADWPGFHGDAAMTGASDETMQAPLQRAWRVELGSAPGSPVMAHGRIYVGTQAKTLLCLNSSDGIERWRYSAGQTLAAAPLVADDLVIVGDEGGILHAVAAASGTLRWKADLGVKITAGASRAGDTIVVGSYANELFCLALADGTERWRFTSDAQVHAAAPVSGGRCVTAGCDSSISSPARKVLRSIWGPAPVPRPRYVMAWPWPPPSAAPGLPPRLRMRRYAGKGR
jgi:glucose dehydrogenase